MDNIRIYYRWSFTLEVITRAKRKYRNHVEPVTAPDYNKAKDMVAWQLAGKGWTLVKIKAARPQWIEFTYYGPPDYGFVDRSLLSENSFPVVPDQL